MQTKTNVATTRKKPRLILSLGINIMLELTCAAERFYGSKIKTGKGCEVPGVHMEYWISQMEPLL